MINLKNSEISDTKKVLKKFLQEISISNQQISGTIFVKGYRKYQHGSNNVRINSYVEEVDIDFSGKIYVAWDGKKDWFPAKLMTLKNHRGQKASKIKVNRFIRKALIKELSIHLNYFSVNINGYSQIKKLNWK